MRKINNKLVISLLSLTLLGACNTPTTLTNNNQTIQQNSNIQVNPISGNAQINKDSVKFNISVPKSFKTKGMSRSYIKMSLKSSAGETYYPTGSDSITHLSPLLTDQDKISLTFNNIKYDSKIVGTLEIYYDGECEGICEGPLKNSYYPTLKTIFKVDSSSVLANIDASTTIAALVYENLKEKNLSMANNIDITNLQAFVNSIFGVSGTSPNLEYTNDLYRSNISIDKIVEKIVTNSGAVDDNTTLDFDSLKISVSLDKESEPSYSNGEDVILSLNGFDYDDIEDIYFDDNSVAFSPVMDGITQDKTKVKVTADNLRPSGNSFYISLKPSNNLNPFYTGLIESPYFTKAAPAFYVNSGLKSGTGTGNSWANASTSLQTALSQAKSGDTILVASGIYHPAASTDTNSNSASFVIPPGVKLYGGFAGNETTLDLTNRDLTNNKTILSGDLEDDDKTDTSKSDNSYTVVKTENDNGDKATIDGFIITSGNAAAYGGGMYNNSSSPTISNVTFSGNTAASAGGGMWNENSSSPTISNVTFSGNTAGYGGGMYNYDHSSPNISNVIFSGNTAASAGGGMSNAESSSPSISNVTFSGNTAGNGGGMYNTDLSSPSISDSTFSGNTATNGGGMYNNYSSSPSISNTTFSGNTANEYGGGMYNTDSSSPNISNVTFSGNTARSGGGGGMYNYSSSPTISDSTFSGNTGFVGGVMYNMESSSPTLTNIMYGPDNTANDIYPPIN